VAGLSWLFSEKKKGIDTVLIVSALLTAAATAFYFTNPEQANTLFYDVEGGIFGDAQITLIAGISVLIGFVLVVLVRILFGKNIDVAAAVTWSMLGNLIGIGFAAISDIWINGYPPAVAIVGEFIPAAGPNLIFAAILVPLLVAAFASTRRQTGR